MDFKGKYYRVLLVTYSKELEKSTLDETLYTIPKKIRNTTGEEVKVIVLNTNCLIGVHVHRGNYSGFSIYSWIRE